MKVAAVLLAIAVASVSAVPSKQPNSRPVNLEEEPAVRANLGAAGKEAYAAGAHLIQGGVIDPARELHSNIVAPTTDVVTNTAKATGHKTASGLNGLVANTFGAASAVGKWGAQGTRKVSEMLYNTAAASSRQHDYYAGAAAERDELAHERAEDAKEPIRRGVDNVKETAQDAKEKVVELKDKSAAKLRSAKEDVKETARDAKENTKDAAEHTGLTTKRIVHKGAAGLGGAIEKTGEKIRETGANLRESQENKVEVVEEDQLHLSQRSSAFTMAAPGAAFAVAAAAAAYLI